MAERIIIRLKIKKRKDVAAESWNETKESKRKAKQEK